MPNTPSKIHMHDITMTGVKLGLSLGAQSRGPISSLIVRGIVTEENWCPMLHFTSLVRYPVGWWRSWYECLECSLTRLVRPC